MTRHAMTRAAALAATLVGTGLVTVAVAGPASASCPSDGSNVRYEVTKIAQHDSTTGLHSDYLKGPGTIQRVSSGTTTKTLTGGGGVGADFNLWVVKINPHVDGSVAKSWSHTAGYNYTKPVPAGKTARLMYFHRTVTALVTKQLWNPGKCTFVTSEADNISAPISTNSYDYWGLQYR